MSWDIFCNVIDNYGDIGVSWRLARQLAKEYGMEVRLWVDDLESFRRLCPEARIVDAQFCKGVEVRRWRTPFPDVAPREVVIESFGCRIPEAYAAKMAAMEKKPVWINLEYLSAEDWVKDCHLVPSPHPQLPLVKHFFFPGFSEKTGGLLLEKDLLARREAFPGRKKADFWNGIGIDPEERIPVSLFCYENPALEALFEACAEGEEKVLCLVPEGKVLPQVKAFFGGGPLSKGNLEARILPFVEQEEYDSLLWACDVNFVRGEDSFVRAQWACKPFVWQIYPQEGEVHLEKLDAFLSLYCESLPGPNAEAMRAMWRAWNGEGEIGTAWRKFLECRMELESHALRWAEKLSGNNLASSLVDFSLAKS